jgi:hypothetical protein
VIFTLVIALELTEPSTVGAERGVD